MTRPLQTAAEWNRFKREYDMPADGGSSEHPTYKHQAEQRVQRVVSDDLGRPWLATIEIATGDPTGPLMPCRSEPQWCDVPDDLVPPAHYVSMRDGTVHIDTEHWKADLRTRLDPRARSPQRVMQEQLSLWRRILSALEAQ